MGQGSEKLPAECLSGSLASLKFGGQRVSPVSFATEKDSLAAPGLVRVLLPTSGLLTVLGSAPAHLPFADPLFTVNNLQEISSDVGGSPEFRPRLWGGAWSDFFGASLVFLLLCSFVALPALRGNFGSLSLLP